MFSLAPHFEANSRLAWEGESNYFSSDQILRILNFLFAINILEFLSLGKNIETASLKISTCDLEGVSMYWNIFSGIRCGNWVIDEQFFCDSFRSYPTLSEKMIIDSILNWKWLIKYLISGNEFIRSYSSNSQSQSIWVTSKK